MGRVFFMRGGAVFAVAVLFGAGMGPVRADTLVLSNGDRLTGSVQLVDGGKLVLKTDYAGEIRIKWEMVEQLQTDDPLLLSARGLPAGYEARLVASAHPGRLAAVPPGEQDASPSVESVPMSDVQRIVRPHRRTFLRDWTFQGGVDVAIDATQASSSNQNWNAALHAQARRDGWRHGLKLDYARNTQDGAVGTHKYNAAYTLDRFLSEKLFLRGRVRHGRDHVDNPADQLVFTAGPGYQFWDDELGAFSMTALLTHTRYKYQDAARENFQTAGLGWDYRRYFAGKQWQLFTNGEVQRSLSRSSGYIVEANLGVRYSVTQWMSLYAKAGYNRVSMAGQPTTNERRYSAGLGVSW